jgi:hypothetical protein
MPFVNEHAARIKDPGQFKEFARKEITSGVSTILGIKEGVSTVQSYRFAKNKFTPEQARTWLKEHDIKFLSFEAAKEKKEDSYNRFDTLPLEVSAIKTDEGFLTGVAIVTRTGIFEYRDAQGGVRRELRLPQEVFDETSIESLKMKPMSNLHQGLVDSGTAKRVQVGFIGENIRHDNEFLSAPFTITHKNTINEVEGGKQELSCGYKCNLEFKPGNWKGKRYDAIQRDIRYNHVAIVQKARAGERARIRLDENDAILENEVVLNNNEGDIKMPDNLKNVKIDGVDYQAEGPVIVELNKYKTLSDDLKTKLDSSKSAEDFSKLEAEKDSLQEKLDSVKETKLDEDQVWEKAKELNSILETAKVSMDAKEFKSLEGKSIIDIKKEVVVKNSKLSMDDLNKKDGIYISARFDSIVENLEEKKVEKADAASVVVGTPGKDEVKEDSVEAHRNSFVSGLENAWMSKEVN